MYVAGRRERNKPCSPKKTEYEARSALDFLEEAGSEFIDPFVTLYAGHLHVANGTEIPVCAALDDGLVGDAVPAKKLVAFRATPARPSVAVERAVILIAVEFPLLLHAPGPKGIQCRVGG